MYTYEYYRYTVCVYSQNYQNQEQIPKLDPVLNFQIS